MRRIDERLQSLFAEDLPTQVDPLFSAGVMEAVARRKLVAEMASLSGVAGLSGVVLWALWPQLAPALATLSQGLAPLGAALALGLGAVMLLGGQIDTAFAGEA